MNKSKNVTIVISAKELRGITLFLLLLVLVIVFPIFLNLKSEDKTPTVEFLGKNSQMASNTNLSQSNALELENIDLPISINSATIEELESIGIPAKTASTLIKFRDSGKTFANAADLEKVYGMNKDLIEKIKQYISFDAETSYTSRSVAFEYQPRKEYQYNSYYQSSERNYKESSSDFSKTKTVSQNLKPVSYDSQEEIEWINAGMSKRMAATTVKFLSKGGSFNKPEDLLKIYGMDSSMYEMIKPQVQFPSSVNSGTDEIDMPSAEKLTSEPHVIQNVALNSSAVQDWIQLPGVGSSYAYRIVNFREKLGGFHSIEQINEVYGLPDSLLGKIREYLIADDFQPSIKINTFSKEELAAHPFMDFKTAGLIVTFRKQHGRFNDFRDLQKMFGIDKKTLDKLQAYIIYD